MADGLKVRQNSYHRTDNDAKVCGEIFIKLSEMLKDKTNALNIEALLEKVCTMIGVKSYEKIARFRGVISA